MEPTYIKFQKFIKSTQYGYTADETSTESGDCKYLRITDIVPYFVDKDHVPYCKIAEGKKSQYIVSNGDLLIARTGATTGYNLVIDDSFNNFIFASYLIRFNLDKNKLYPLFVKYVLKSKSWYGFVNNYVGGSAQPGMNARVFGKFDFPYLPLPTQRRIASILSTYDALIQNYKRQIATLQSAASELYKEWFVRFRFPGYKNAKFDNGLPVGWKVERVKNCVNRLPFGQTYKKDELESKGKVIVIDQSEDEYLGFHNYEPSHKASAENPIALFGDHSCKYQLMIKNFSLGENIIPYTAKNVDLYYLYFAVYKIVQTEEYKRHWSLFVNKKILIPNNDLQMKFRFFIIPLFKKIEMIKQQITNLTTQRDLLLPRLMSGKLSVE